MNRDFKGIWISRDIWLSDDLTITEKAFVAEIDSLSTTEEGCFAKLQHFVNFSKLSKSRCSEIITALIEKGFVQSLYEKRYGNEVRILRIIDVCNSRRTGVRKTEQGVRKTELLYKDENTNEYTTTTIGKIEIEYEEIEKALITNTPLLINVSKDQNIKTNTVCALVPKFVSFIRGTQKAYTNHSDLYGHFGSWVRKQDVKDVDVVDEFNWFMKMFNAVSKRDFKSTEVIKQLFIVQLDNGFTGMEMQKAVENLYHSKNEWHRKTRYEHATPEFLLKQENLNKFLNAKY